MLLATYTATSINFDYPAFRLACRDLGARDLIFSDNNDGSFRIMAYAGNIAIYFNGILRPETFDTDFPKAVQAHAVDVGA